MKCKLFVKDNITDFYNSNLYNLDFVFLIYNKELSLLDELEEPEVSRELCRLSKENSFILFFHFVAVIEDKKYLSVMVIDNGRILGVSDSVTATDYCNSQRQRIYMTSKGRVGVVVDEDIYHTDSVSSLCHNKANMVVFMSAKDFSERFYKAFCCHKFFQDIKIMAAFQNKFCLFDNECFLGEKDREYDFEINLSSSRQIKMLKSPTFEY